MKRSAVISDDGVYRYSLRREWGGYPGVVVFVMLNPGAADAEVDDPTIRRCINFAQRWQYGGLVVVNLFALRATDPKELLTHADPRGPYNFDHLKSETTGREVIAAWGANPKAEIDALVVRKFLSPSRLNCLGVTKSGAPCHPLSVKADAERAPWPQEGSS